MSRCSWGKKAEHKKWIGQKSMDLVRIRRDLKEQRNASRTRSSRVGTQEEYRAAAKEVKKSIKKDK